MKNTFIPLDMLFIGADRHIVGIVENAVPADHQRAAGGAPSLYVLEIGGGLSAPTRASGAGRRSSSVRVPTP